MGIAVVDSILDKKIEPVSQRNTNWKQSILLVQDRKMDLKLRMQLVEKQLW